MTREERIEQVKHEIKLNRYFDQDKAEATAELIAVNFGLIAENEALDRVIMRTRMRCREISGDRVGADVVRISKVLESRKGLI